MNYDSWKLASPEEGVDLGDWESDAKTAVEELCAHGEHPIECSLCTSAGLIAAVSGEEEDMDQDTTDDSIDQWIAQASVVKLKRAYFAIENEVARRKDAVAAEAKALEQFEKPVRKQRSDAGTTRPRKTEAA